MINWSVPALVYILNLSQGDSQHTQMTLKSRTCVGTHTCESIPDICMNDIIFTKHQIIVYIHQMKIAVRNFLASIDEQALCVLLKLVLKNES